MELLVAFTGLLIAFLALVVTYMQIDSERVLQLKLEARRKREEYLIEITAKLFEMLSFVINKYSNEKASFESIKKIAIHSIESKGYIYLNENETRCIYNVIGVLSDIVNRCLPVMPEGTDIWTNNDKFKEYKQRADLHAKLYDDALRKIYAIRRIIGKENLSLDDQELFGLDKKNLPFLKKIS